MKERHLTAAEVAPIWTGFLGDSMANGVLRYFIATAEEREVKDLLKYALGMTEDHMAFKKELEKRGEIVLPLAFSEQDVHVDAPRLFSDLIMLYYMRQMGIGGTVAYSLALATSTRADLREFFNQNLKTAAELLERATTMLLDKGFYMRAPILAPAPAEKVRKEGWLNGLLGDRRPLNAVEITHLHLNTLSNGLGKALMIGFSQTAKSKEVRDFTIRARDIASKHIDVFSQFLKDDQLPAPGAFEAEVTASTEAPFTDKFILFHTLSLTAIGIGNYGSAASASPRRDLASAYLRFAAEVGTFADDGAELMIEKGWLEKIPGAIERDALIPS
ncbi:DUF3231 family protein [Paenibacillus methanolicus]|uniref:Uncharacterized protein DUF3231 n=1 Tax=Paenibacillus methanolicus TaxID=582686 RepID=A0A5S5BT85_9BACL|nr:DUF3231 family protein [Paenibacillus methanolicus]TYP69558.1 uncharacterized protein DUF3231 [Paenibacillus methanolicus]